MSAFRRLLSILSWIRRLPQAAIRALAYLYRSLFCRHFLQRAKTKTFKSPHARLACVTLSERRLLSWISFRTCLRSHSARKSVDRSWTDLRPPPEAIQVGSIPDRSQKKCERSHSARIKTKSICERGQKETLKNPFASRLAEFDTTLNLLRIPEQWYIVPFKFQFGRNRELFALLSLPLAGETRQRKRFNGHGSLISLPASIQVQIIVKGMSRNGIATIKTMY